MDSVFWALWLATQKAKGNGRVKRSRAFLNIEAKRFGAHLGKGNCSISSSERILFRLFDFFGAFFAWFGDGRTWTRRFRLPCTFPPLRFICWTIDGIGALYVFTYIFFARTLSLARINVVTMLRSKSERTILFYFPLRWHSLLINTPGDYVNKDEKAEVACDPPPDQRLSRVDPVCF